MANEFEGERSTRRYERVTGPFDGPNGELKRRFIPKTLYFVRGRGPIVSHCLSKYKFGSLFWEGPFHPRTFPFFSMTTTTGPGQ